MLSPRTLIFNAAWNGEYFKVFELMVVHDIDPNIKAHTSPRTMLDFACQHGHVELVRTLLAHPKINVNVRDGMQWTPFATAIAQGSTECAKLLIDDSRTDLIKSTGSNHKTPLYRISEGGYVEILEYWIASGKSFSHNTSEYWAAYNADKKGEIQKNHGRI
jgi:ankyrin repeat protein